MSATFQDVSLQQVDRMPAYLSRLRLDCLAVAILALGVGAVAAEEETIVTQKGTVFNPTAVSLHKGDTMTIVNDDGSILHHAYIESEAFNFDSGDQKPGSRTKIVFGVPGRFVVLCGIHPKMKLTVIVK